MDAVIKIIGLFFVTSSGLFLISTISLLVDDLKGKISKRDEIIWRISFVVFMLSLAAMVIYFIKNPQPTFKEVCEANNGTYIANNGRAGDSCIYNKQEIKGE